jgi:hypothetical protein
MRQEPSFFVILFKANFTLHTTSSFHKVCTFLLFLSEGQAGEILKYSNKVMIFEPKMVDMCGNIFVHRFRFIKTFRQIPQN